MVKEDLDRTCLFFALYMFVPKQTIANILQPSLTGSCWPKLELVQRDGDTLWYRWYSKSALYLARSTCGPDPSADHLLFAYAKDFEGNDSYRISFKLSLLDFRLFRPSKEQELKAILSLFFRICYSMRPLSRQILVWLLFQTVTRTN